MPAVEQQHPAAAQPGQREVVRVVVRVVRAGGRCGAAREVSAKGVGARTPRAQPRLLLGRGGRLERLGPEAAVIAHHDEPLALACRACRLLRLRRALAGALRGRCRAGRGRCVRCAQVQRAHDAQQAHRARLQRRRAVVPRAQLVLRSGRARAGGDARRAQGWAGGGRGATGQRTERRRPRAVGGARRARTKRIRLSLSAPSAGRWPAAA